MGPHRCALLHVYTDGVSISGTTKAYAPESLLVFYWTPVGHSRDAKSRRVFTVFKKSKMCQCGCKGQCTLQAALKVLSWSLSSLQIGKWPSHGPTQCPLEGWRAEKAGQALNCHGALAQMSADWIAFGETLQLHAHSSNEGPCCLCTCSGGVDGNMHAYALKPWVDRTHADWEADRDASCIVVKVGPP